MQLSLDWINNKEELIDIDEEIDKTIEAIASMIGKHSLIVKTSLETVSKRIETNNVNIVVRKNKMLQRMQQTQTARITSDGSLSNTDKVVEMKGISAVLDTDVGLINTTNISACGEEINGQLKLSPWIKFYLGKLLKTSQANRVRAQPKGIFCFPGFIMNNNEKCYQVTSIIGNTLIAILVNGSDKDVITLNKHTCNSVGFNWVILSDCTSTAVSNIDYEFGEPVMPAKSSRKRTYIPYKYNPVPDDKRKRTKKNNTVSKSG